ncbi:hypothetical protein ACFV0T_26455 [Streptomyces sp. NPDC059582]|uniref:hypothetical protein n=1 Tax=Streptomyces sp. NPDC059582 TaxID=3346875 RepID=UPI00368FD506
MSRKKPRPAGVSLAGRSMGLHYWDDETSADGGKKFLRRLVRAREKAALRRSIRKGDDI